MMNKRRWLIPAIAGLSILLAFAAIALYSTFARDDAIKMSAGSSDNTDRYSSEAPHSSTPVSDSKMAGESGDTTSKPTLLPDESGKSSGKTDAMTSSKGPDSANSNSSNTSGNVSDSSDDILISSDTDTHSGDTDPYSSDSLPSNQIGESDKACTEPAFDWHEIVPNMSDSLTFEKQQKDPRDEQISQVFPKTYTELEGILTFRGGPFRDRPSWGVSSITEKKLSIKWKYTTPFTSSWGGGGGWTGQPAAVRWPAETKAHMNLYPEYKEKEGFVEILFASLNGNIYFLDMETGLPSRDKIKIGNPFKGSLSLDPRGYPLLYAGDGIADTSNFGFRIYSLIDGSILHFQNGRDNFAYRYWGAFDSSAAFNPLTDTLFVCGENGLFYKILLNSKLDLQNDSIVIDPSIEKYRYKVKGNSFQGIENSPVFYNHYAFFADNGGWIQAIDLNSLKPVWAFDNKDDTDASLVLSIEGNNPYLYCGNEVDHQGTKGTTYIRKINALTGTQVWEKGYECLSVLKPKPINGGLLATGAVGKKDLSDRMFFTLARYGGISKGLMVALNKETGEELWRLPMDHYAWSSPVDFYDTDGNGFLIQCNSAGNMMLIDAKSGEVLDVVNLGSNIESSPIVFEDTVVVATRGGQVYCIEIN